MIVDYLHTQKNQSWWPKERRFKLYDNWLRISQSRHFQLYENWLRNIEGSIWSLRKMKWFLVPYIMLFSFLSHSILNRWMDAPKFMGVRDEDIWLYIFHIWLPKSFHEFLHTWLFLHTWNVYGLYSLIIMMTMSVSIHCLRISIDSRNGTRSTSFNLV